MILYLHTYCMVVRKPKIHVHYLKRLKDITYKFSVCGVKRKEVIQTNHKKSHRQSLLVAIRSALISALLMPEKHSTLTSWRGQVNIGIGLMTWKFLTMLMQHSVKIWLAVQDSDKCTASWLVDNGKLWEDNYFDICTTYVLQIWRRCGDDTISSGSQWPITYKNLLMISLVHASMMAFTNIDSLDITVKILNHIPAMKTVLHVSHSFRQKF